MGKREDQGGWLPSGFGTALKEARERAGLSQEQLAQKAGCSLFTISRLERGLNEPAWPLVIAVAKALGVTTDSLRHDSGVNRPAEPTGSPAKGVGTADTLPPAGRQPEGEPEPTPKRKRSTSSKPASEEQAPGEPKKRTRKRKE